RRPCPSTRQRSGRPRRGSPTSEGRDPIAAYGSAAFEEVPDVLGSPVPTGGEIPRDQPAKIATVGPDRLVADRVAGRVEGVLDAAPHCLQRLRDALGAVGLGLLVARGNDLAADRLADDRLAAGLGISVSLISSGLGARLPQVHLQLQRQ